MSKLKRADELLPEDWQAIEKLNVAQQLQLAETLESRARAIRLHALEIRDRKKRHGNGHHHPPG
jgi:hypothetical protein